MVGKAFYSSVPTAVELENNSNQKKYTVNRNPGGLVISKPLCTLMGIGALLLAVLAGLLVFFLAPRGSDCLHTNGALGVTDEGVKAHMDAIALKQIDERLPRSIEPTHYRLQIMPFLNNLTTHGVSTITVHVKEPTDQIIFHVVDIEIDKMSVKVKPAKSNDPLPIKSQDYQEGQRYQIVLTKALEKNSMYTIEMMFVSRLDHKLQGFYRSEYEDVVNNSTLKKDLASTQFSPTDARRAFPCFDEPSFKANFSISIARLSNYTSLSNMMVEKTEQDFTVREWIWDHYHVTPKMSTYLVAMVVSDLKPSQSFDPLIKVWTRENLVRSTRYAAEIAPKILRFFERYFHVDFPLAKIDIVAIPDFGYNAMENWGLITFRESALLYDYQESDIDDKRHTATVLAHEIAHQWFGNLVTPKWWNDLWLKEGFATYLEYAGVEYAEPSWSIQQEFMISEMYRSFAIDGYASSRPISFTVQNSQQIRQTFDDLSYGKGACIIRMMNHVLGESSFKAGLISFLGKHQYGNADRDDLFAALTAAGHNSKVLEEGLTIKQIMDSWTEQPGFPVITAIADRVSQTLTISQKRFLYTGTHQQNSTWWVPISVTTNRKLERAETKPTFWLKNEPTITVKMDFDQWYLLNINQTGYFIVNYDENNWRMLTENIMSLPPLIRAQLLSDSMDLAHANLLDYDIPLKLLAYMAMHDEQVMLVPTITTFKKLSFLSDMFSNTPAFGIFETFQSTIFQRTYDLINSDTDYSSDDYFKQKIRRAVLEWACRKTDSVCAVNSHHMFRRWMDVGNRLKVPPNLRDVVYCTAIRQGTEAEWEFAYHQYLTTQSVSERNILLDALGCTTKKWLLSRYLDYLPQNNSSIRIQDGERVFKSVSDNSITNSMAFDFLRTNWHALVQHYGDGFNIIGKMVANLPRYMNTEYQLAELIRFRDEVNGSIGAASQAFDLAIERVKGNVAWMKKNYHSVESWLQDHRHNFGLM